VSIAVLIFASSAGALVMKPATQRTLRLFGFRDTLVWNGLLSAIMIAVCASFRPTWPAAAIYGALLIGGFFRSLQFTSLNGMAYADLEQAQMSRGTYTKFVFFMGVGLPLLMVAFLTLVYSNARDMKMPNRDYWLAPERIAETRALLVAHGVCFGSLMTAMVCYVHWMILDAHRSAPPHLSNRLVAGGLFVFFIVVIAGAGATVGAVVVDVDVDVEVEVEGAVVRIVRA